MKNCKPTFAPPCKKANENSLLLETKSAGKSSGSNTNWCEVMRFQTL